MRASLLNEQSSAQCTLFLENEMTDAGRVVTAKLSQEVASHMDTVSDRIDRSKSWIIRQAIHEWLTEEQRRFELGVEALDCSSQERDEAKINSTESLSI
jgi:predicted DNA-binding protein